MLLFLQAELDLVTGDGGYDFVEDTDNNKDEQSLERTESMPPWIGYLIWDVQMWVLFVYQTIHANRFQP